MNKRIRKKQITIRKRKEDKILHEFAEQLKKLAKEIDYDYLPKSYPDTIDIDALSEYTKELCNKTTPQGFICSDVIMNQSDGVISGTIHIIPTEFPIDIKILKDRKEDTFIE